MESLVGPGQSGSLHRDDACQPGRGLVVPESLGDLAGQLRERGNQIRAPNAAKIVRHRERGHFGAVEDGSTGGALSRCHVASMRTRRHSGVT